MSPGYYSINAAGLIELRELRPLQYIDSATLALLDLYMRKALRLRNT